MPLSHYSFRIAGDTSICLDCLDDHVECVNNSRALVAGKYFKASYTVDSVRCFATSSCLESDVEYDEPSSCEEGSGGPLCGVCDSGTCTLTLAVRLSLVSGLG